MNGQLRSVLSLKQFKALWTFYPASYGILFYPSVPDSVWAQPQSHTHRRWCHLSQFSLVFTSWRAGLIWLLAETYDDLALPGFYLHSDMGRGLLIVSLTLGADSGGLYVISLCSHIKTSHWSQDHIFHQSLCLSWVKIINL